MWHYNSSEELYHYGVKGMKWGRRSARPYWAPRPVARKKVVGGVSNGVQTGKKLTSKEYGQGRSTVGDDHDAYNKYHPVLGDTAAANSRAEKKSEELVKNRIEKLLKKKKERNKRKAASIYLENQTGSSNGLTRYGGSAKLIKKSNKK